MVTFFFCLFSLKATVKAALICTDLGKMFSLRNSCENGVCKTLEVPQTDTEVLHKNGGFFSAFNLLAFLSYFY